MKWKSQYLTVKVWLKRQPNIAVLLTDIFILTYKVAQSKVTKRKNVYDFSRRKVIKPLFKMIIMLHIHSLKKAFLVLAHTLISFQYLAVAILLTFNCKAIAQVALRLQSASDWLQTLCNQSESVNRDECSTSVMYFFTVGDSTQLDSWLYSGYIPI